ncbi:hypothetical protein imdm_1614 [gamma proteobacterium IMCC2047]|nr:hypothetical protein imdm_1614 [gamma proteobacterium IMCC2047]
MAIEVRLFEYIHVGYVEAPNTESSQCEQVSSPDSAHACDGNTFILQ